ncbi:heterokaryon incompatibility protein-domain-containing protein [Tricladium varicosporioides]|nr:heterokaryon incompatibility protein-domain-containing protein [Hymenoscyphus varicosporioides]
MEIVRKIVSPRSRERSNSSRLSLSFLASLPPLSPQLSQTPGPVQHAPLCAKCSKVDVYTCFFQGSGVDYNVRYKLDDVRISSKNCSVCTLLYQAWKDGRFSRSDGAIFSTCVLKPHITGTYYIGERSINIYRIGVHPCLKGIAQEEYLGVQLALNTSEDPLSPENLFRGRAVNTERADLKRIRNWCESCSHNHGTKCKPIKWKRDNDMQIRMINVRERRVMNAPPGCEYFALSYLWGSSAPLKLTSETEERLTSLGGLSDPLEDIPQTIKDAIYLTERLGKVFLWVDAICIKQDDPDDRTRQINNMGSIYAGAKMTIACAVGHDSNAGLPGVRRNSRTTKQYVADWKGHKLISTSRPYSECMKRSTWNYRGWVFQEANLSQRLLVFTEEQVYFHCQTTLWCEGTNVEVPPQLGYPSPSERLNDVHGRVSRDITPLQQYFLTVSRYCRRQLTEATDSLNAIQGILNFMEIGACYHGIPESYFDKAILWISCGISPQMRRPSSPSWSWAGWDLSNIDDDATLEFLSTIDQTLAPEVVWERPGSIGSPESFITPQARPTQANWERPFIRRGLSVERVTPSGVSENLSSQLLCFYTTSTTLNVDRHKLPPEKRGRNRFYRFVDSRQRTVAMLFLDSKWLSTQPDMFEFVVVARLWSNERWPEDDDGLYIMLIEWKDGIAYRVQLAVDPVPISQWARLDLKWKYIAMG